MRMERDVDEFKVFDFLYSEISYTVTFDNGLVYVVIIIEIDLLNLCDFILEI